MTTADEADGFLVIAGGVALALGTAAVLLASCPFYPALAALGALSLGLSALAWSIHGVPGSRAGLAHAPLGALGNPRPVAW